MITSTHSKNSYAYFAITKKHRWILNIGILVTLGVLIAFETERIIFDFDNLIVPYIQFAIIPLTGLIIGSSILIFSLRHRYTK